IADLAAADSPTWSTEHLHLAVERHQAGFHAELRVALPDLLAELRERSFVRFGLHLRVCHLRLAISDPGSAAIAMVDCDDFLDVVQLNRRAEIVPKCLVPVLERGRDDADRRASDDELAELAGYVLIDGIFVYRLLHARIDAGQYHRLIVPLGRKREVWSDGQGRTTYRNGPYKEPAIEFAIQKIAATRAGSLTSNHLQTFHFPPLAPCLPQIEPFLRI